MERLRVRYLGLVVLCAGALLLLLSALTPTLASADETTAYAVYNDTTHTLTFTHDSASHANGSSGPSTDVPGLSGTWYAVAGGTDAAWSITELEAGVQSVVFDDTCATDKIAPSSTRHWFAGMSNLTSIQNIDRLDTSNVTNMEQMFSGCSSLAALDVSGFDTSSVIDMGAMFADCSSLATLDVTGFDTSNVTTMSSIYFPNGMFAGCSSLTSLDVSGFDTSHVTDMDAMFAGCSSLTSLDVSGLNTSNVTRTRSMFRGCSSLAALDVTGFDTSHVTDMDEMFADCSSLTALDVAGFDTSHVTDMHWMFWGCNSLASLDVSRFDTSSATYMQGMFGSCSSLTSLDVSGFNTSNATDIREMFYGCSSLLALDVTGFDTSNVTDMGMMFRSCGSLTSLDLRSFDTSQVASMREMFLFDRSLQNLVLGENWSWTGTATSTTHYALLDQAPESDTSGGRYTGKWAVVKGTTPDSTSSVQLSPEELQTSDPDIGKVHALTWGVEPVSEYTLRYDANGGQSAPADDSLSVLSSQAGSRHWTVSEQVPSREGYEFAGWNGNADGSGEAYVADEHIALPAGSERSMTLYAQWRPVPTIPDVDEPGAPDNHGGAADEHHPNGFEAGQSVASAAGLSGDVEDAESASDAVQPGEDAVGSSPQTSDFSPLAALALGAAIAGGVSVFSLRKRV